MSLGQSIISSVISYSKEKSTVAGFNVLSESLLKRYQLGFRFERVRASDGAALSQSIFNPVCQFLVTRVGIELLGVHGGVSQDLLSFRRDSSSRKVYDFNCRKFDIKCIKENVENISGFPVTSQ